MVGGRRKGGGVEKRQSFRFFVQHILGGLKDPGVQGFEDLQQVIEGATGAAGGQNCIAVLIKSIRPLKSPAAATM